MIVQNISHSGGDASSPPQAGLAQGAEGHLTIDLAIGKPAVKVVHAAFVG